MNELQLTLILAWYYFDKSNNVESFARRFNQYFEKDYSAQTILFSSAKFKNVDPANNLRQSTPDERYKTLWDKYIVGDRIRELKELGEEYMIFSAELKHSTCDRSKHILKRLFFSYSKLLRLIYLFFISLGIFSIIAEFIYKC